VKVIASADILLLEETILERVSRRPHGGLLDPILVLVPTGRLATHLKRLLAGRLGAVLGVHVLTHRGLAVRAIEGSLEQPPNALPAAVLDLLMAEVARRVGGSEGEHVLAFEGARAALLSTFADLREAGIGPEAFAASAAASPFLREAYRGWCEALGRLRRDGLSDAAGIVEAAIPLVPGFARRKGFREVLHHGAYELIGIHVDLLRALDSAAPVTLLLPAGLKFRGRGSGGSAPKLTPSGPAFAYASRFAEVLRTAGAVFEEAPASLDPGREAWIRRLDALYRPDGGPGTPPPAVPALEIRHSQGAEGELRAAALRALALHDRDGIPLHEIAIVARTLEPYAPFLASTFDGLGIPFATSAASPVSRDPAASVLLALLRVLAGDFERRAMVDLLRRGRLAVPGGAPTPGEIDLWDRRSREARVASGLEAWRSVPALYGPPPDVPAESPSPGEGRSASPALRLAAVLDVLEEDRRTWLAARTLEEHAALIERLARDRLRLAPDGGLPEPVLPIIEAVRAAGRASAACGGIPGSVPEIYDLARRAAEETGGPIRDDPGGVRVLDLLQARGLAHRAVIWIGFHDGLFPAGARPDPWLDDESRAALRAGMGRSLAPKLAAAEEERLLLALALGSARERLVISYQRADEGGRTLARSSALREVARAFAGRPDAATLVAARGENPHRPEHVPVHFGDRALHLARSARMGLVPVEDAVAGAAARSRRPVEASRAVAAALGLSGEDREAALAFVEVVERFAPGDATFDGAAAGIDPAGKLSPTAVERLARCPLSFFLRDVLRLHELDEEAVPHRIEGWILGNSVHAVLADLYRRLDRSRALLAAADPIPDALELLGRLWRDEVARAAGPAHGRLLGLFALLGDRWLAKLREFVERDLRDLRIAGVRRLLVEEDIVESVGLPADPAIHLGGRLDRLVEDEAGFRIDDYKTGGNLETKVKGARLLKGLDLQLFLYREMVAARERRDPAAVRANLLGVGPEVDVEEVALEAPLEVRDGIIETVAAAIRLARSGRFPLLPDSNDARYCGWCGYRRACRRTHAPTLSRLEVDPDLTDIRDARRKTMNRPSLKAVREAEVGTAATT
jgi:ATP-dependent helicase/nuclease subunit B